MAPASQQPAEEAEDNGAQSEQSQLRWSRRASLVSIAPNMIPTLPPAQSQKRHVVPSLESKQSNTNGKTSKNRKVTKKPRQVASLKATGSAKKSTPQKTLKSQIQKSVAEKSINQADKDYDYDQVSDNRLVEIQPREVKKKEEKFTDVTDYFHPPFFKEDKAEKGGEPLNYKCCWCHKVYCGHSSTDGNLTMHCEGSNQAGRNAKGCPKQNEAKASGTKLPPSIAKKRLIDGNQIPMSSFLQAKPVFVNRVLNQIVMIWQVRQAIAWARIEDTFLCAAFLYANPKALLFGKQWSADESKTLYVVLKTTVFEDLKKLDTKFTLIHNVWTTKGNRFAFIGAAMAYVDSNWDYVVRHIALKMIPWKHHGNPLARPIAALLKEHDLYKKMLVQTTDSGSNNNTMASTMYQLLNSNNPLNESKDSWDPASMHIKCFCHKLALIVNAGLDVLSLKTLPPGKAKESVLGFFSVHGKVLEEDETESLEGAPEVKVAPGPKTNPAVIEEDNKDNWQSDYGNADNICDDESAAAFNTGATDLADMATLPRWMNLRCHILINIAYIDQFILIIFFLFYYYSG
ncbi:hypothetical protein PTTG_30191 [Puccinia triticina 1-1 BBBD Race 1]|uniref:BED-type domain-containing protein n=1 Tax=Puccinia triticina (isolate 1-1 / race 1 (BBBD)) TaxID=630390 RepID=A0A180FZS2_PUCT1|nr:hypothetical protein PTTG_30191 [Puccinia triticina 1-1 BBBD Race 1]